MSLNLERFSNKTRVLICGKKDRKQVSELLLFVIKFLGNNIDYITEKQNSVLGNDFVVFEVDENHDDFLNIKPNIAAITGNEDDSEKIELLLKTITPGGILIYNEEDENLKDLVENAENYFRRIPYKTPAFQISNQTIYLNTDLGEVPLNFAAENISFVSAVKHLCQHMGIQQEEFYEALMNFEG